MAGITCADLTCLNGATCKSDSAGVRCLCPAGFIGRLCGVKMTTTTEDTSKTGQTLNWQIAAATQKSALYSPFYDGFWVDSSKPGFIILAFRRW